VLRWLPWIVPGAVMLVWVHGTLGSHEPAQRFDEPAESKAEAQEAGRADGGTSGVGEGALTAPSVEPVRRSSWGSVAVGFPKGPLPGQRRPPCELRGDVEIRGGCWDVHESMKPPCEPGYYEWGEGCYVPSMGPQRQPTSDPP
jgi:hypothetical protein